MVDSVASPWFWFVGLLLEFVQNHMKQEIKTESGKAGFDTHDICES